MLKTQYIIVGVSLLFAIGLFLLPKSVVSNKSKAIEKSAQAQTTENDSVVEPALAESHQVMLTDKQTQQLNILRNSFLKSNSEKDKSMLLDSMAYIFRSSNLIDSVAYYAELLSNQFPNTPNFLSVADAYYDVFSFAMSEQKVKYAAQKSRVFYEKVLAVEPENADVKVKLGVTYTITATPMQGIKMIREVLEKEPENQLAIFNLGLLSMQSGQYEKAVERFEKLIKINPKDVNSCLLLAQSLVNLGKTKEAIDSLEKFKANLSASPLDTEIKQRINTYLQDLKK
ncbi:MAG: tetratricopeptide repeat protein [Cytophagales bacterium]|nr:MAG: tetratricopeptide repeat protein [Cytophagales bacterium]